MPGHRHAALGALSALLLLAILAPNGAGASLRLIGGPPNGHAVVAGAGGAVIPLRWEADVSGCVVPAYAPSPPRVVTGVANGPRPFRGELARGDVPSGAGEMRYSRPTVRERYSWYLSMTCAGVGEVRTAARTIRIFPPDPRPRLAGRWALAFRAPGEPAERRLFRIFPDCPSGPCGGRDGAGRRWSANPRAGVYALRWSEPAACEARNGLPVARGVARVRTARMKVIRKRLVGTDILAARMAGTWATIERLTKRGRRAGCRPEHRRGSVLALAGAPSMIAPPPG